MPYIQQVATGIRPELSVYGQDYNTRDGTAVRDYIHVMDLAEGHVAAVQKLMDNPDLGCIPINLGTGTGSTVLEMIKVLQLCTLETWLALVALPAIHLYIIDCDDQYTCTIILNVDSTSLQPHCQLCRPANLLAHTCSLLVNCAKHGIPL